jgi:small-conductance mechanosensitive channel
MSVGTQQKKNFSKILGNAILLASIQASIGSVEMSSKFSVINFAKDQETLQAASNALTGYLIIAIIWSIGAVLISYGQYGWDGFWTSLVANSIMILWIVISYVACFSSASKRYNLDYPKLFRL